MDKAKKRKHKRFEHDTPSAFSTSAKSHKKGHIRGTSQTSQMEFSAWPMQNFQGQVERSNRSLPSGLDRARSCTPSLQNEKNQNTNNVVQDDMPPPHSARSSFQRHIEHNLQDPRIPGTFSSKKDYNSTIISPPLDHGLDYMRDFWTENRRRSGQYQLFTSDVSGETGSGPEIPSSVQGSNDDNATEDSNRSYGKNKEFSSSSSSSSTESSSEEDSGSDSTSDSECETTAAARHLQSEIRAQTSNPKIEQEIKPAIMGRELLEEMQRQEKARMEKATQKGKALPISAHQTQDDKPNPNHRAAISNLNTMPQTSNLSKLDQKLLQSLHSLIPPHILSNARCITTSKQSHNSNLSTTLTAARLLILQLSGSRLATSLNPSTSVSSGAPDFLGLASTTTQQTEVHVQSELIRIAKDREQQVKRLEMEVKDLSDQLEQHKERGRSGDVPKKEQRRTREKK